MSKLLLLVPAAVLSMAVVCAQQTQTIPKVTPYTDIPAEASKQGNPFKSTPESLAHARKWWKLDCAMCHGKDGDGKGEVAASMKLTVGDFTNPTTLKERSDGELFYIIKNGHHDMPPEGNRIKPEEGWDLVNYVRSLSKPKPEPEQKP